MEANINAHCSICGKGYHLCKACQNQKKIRPWRSVTDTAEHYKIYMAVHGYTISGNREQARRELQKCDLSGLDHFNVDIKNAIEEILRPRRRTRKSGSAD